MSLEDALERNTAALMRNAALMEQALTERGIEVPVAKAADAPKGETAKAEKPAEAPTKAEKPKAAATKPPAAKTALPTDLPTDLPALQRVATQFLLLGPAAGDPREFLKAISAEKGVKKVSEVDEADRQTVIAWILMKAAGLDVNFDDETALETGTALAASTVPAGTANPVEWLHANKAPAEEDVV